MTNEKIVKPKYSIEALEAIEFLEKEIEDAKKERERARAEAIAAGIDPDVMPSDESIKTFLSEMKAWYEEQARTIATEKLPLLDEYYAEAKRGLFEVLKNKKANEPTS